MNSDQEVTVHNLNTSTGQIIIQYPETIRFNCITDSGEIQLFDKPIGPFC